MLARRRKRRSTLMRPLRCDDAPWRARARPVSPFARPATTTNRGGCNMSVAMALPTGMRIGGARAPPVIRPLTATMPSWSRRCTEAIARRGRSWSSVTSRSSSGWSRARSASMPRSPTSSRTCSSACSRGSAASRTPRRCAAGSRRSRCSRRAGRIRRRRRWRWIRFLAPEEVPEVPVTGRRARRTRRCAPPTACSTRSPRTSEWRSRCASSPRCS